MDELLGKLEVELNSKGLSAKTKKSYMFFVKDFERFFGKDLKDAREVM